MSVWNSVVQFSQNFLEQVDLNAEERDYKIAFARGAKVARQQLMEGQQQWFETLRREITKTNLVNQYFMMALIKAFAEKPDELRAAILEFWVDPVSPDKLDKLEQDLRALNPERLAAGGAIAFGALLLMAVSPTQYPPFRARQTAEFIRLVGREPLKSSASPTARYDQVLETIDELVEHAQSTGLPIRDRLDAQGLMWTLSNTDPDSSWPRAEADAFRSWRGDKTSSSPSYVRGSGKSPTAEEAAWKILEPGLLGAPSPIDGKTQTWTQSASNSLLETRKSQDIESGKFLERLEPQLTESSNDVYLLAAELIYLQCIALSNIRSETKSERINTVLSWSPEGPSNLPPELEEALKARGSFNGGMGFNMHIAAHHGWLLRFVKHLRSVSQTELDVALSSPWGWMAFTAAVPDDVPAIRYTIDYLVWPNYLQPVVSKEDRKKIRDTFAHLLGGARGNSEVDIAQDLHDILQIQNGESETYAEWYAEPYKSQWQKTTGTERKAWLVRQAQAGNPMAETWQAEGIVTLPAQTLGEEIIGQDFESVLSSVKDVYGHINFADQKDKAKELHRFATQMNEGDLVIAAWEEVLLVGTVDSKAYVGDFHGNKLCRTVDWHPNAVPNADLPDPLPRLLGEPGGIVDVSEAVLAIESWRKRPTTNNGEDPGAPGGATLKPRIDVVPQLKNASDELAAKLHVKREDLQEIVDLLRTRQQIVLYGPPGTGKTFIGKHLARYLAGTEHAEHVQIVQFHPSYSYEDFFEGFRPSASTNGQVGFELQPGPLRRIAKLASQPGNEDKPFFLLIDEMNRGNLAKVFGELYFLLEYRKDSIRLQYSPDEDFTLPQNLFIIGTMNTADRSIAMVDAAIRRRFAFIELHPQDGIIKDVLGSFLTFKKRSPLAADLLNALNGELGSDKRDLAVGPSYFMKDDALDAEGLRRVWKYELLPLLEEYHFGELDRAQVHERFSLDALLLGLNRSLDELQFLDEVDAD
ncbi:AAA family ATPase [Arthrobacter sp. S41]|uniref:McrB family protein n=1 Tax=Arthrobacter sp. S41 TaxID=2509721 RepID=UPI001036534B|nr:AAA family ATPase [Arthrobacter sp. S41]TAP27841.1 AAA family ATPase [Arthrobacter sp. S41]